MAIGRRLQRAVLAFCMALFATTLLFSSAALADAPATGPGAPIPFRLFPADNPWNEDVATLPVDPRSDAYIARIGADAELHPDFGTVWDGGPNGIPYNVVRASQAKVPVTFYYADESDPGPYPIPAGAQIEWGSDHHLLILDVDNRILYELYDVSYSAATGSWTAGSGAIWDLKTDYYRPVGWTSADAAGLPMLPGLVRYDEVAGGEITHALRFTVSETQRAYIFPASHYASDSTDPDLPPMGLRLRLKASYDISGFSATDQVVLRALKRYGMIVADNGGPLYMSGAPDARWNDDDLHAISAIHGSDFEVVDTSGAPQPSAAPPRVSLGAAVRMRAGRTFSRWARFADASGASWSATVNYGDGSGTKHLALASGKRFHLVHRYRKRGTSYVVVKVRNDAGLTGAARLKVVVRR
jgi:hypothetical protein